MMSGARSVLLFGDDHAVAEEGVRAAYHQAMTGQAAPSEGPRDDPECCICFDDQVPAQESYWRVGASKREAEVGTGLSMRGDPYGLPVPRASLAALPASTPATPSACACGTGRRCGRSGK